MEYEKPIPSGASMNSSDALRLHLVGFKLIFPVVVNPSVRNGPSSLNAPIVAAHGGPALFQPHGKVRARPGPSGGALGMTAPYKQHGGNDATRSLRV